MSKIIKRNVLIYLFIVLAALFVACSNDNLSSDNLNAPNQSAKKNATLEGFKQINVKEGDGTLALKNSKVAVHYTGWLYDANAKDKKGKMFDTSFDLGDPFVFILGKKMVIKGWEAGIPGMKVGSKRTLLIPSDMAYGSKSMGTARTAIPANSALVFDVELIDVM